MIEDISPEQDPKKWMGHFFTIWSGQAMSLLGSQLVQFALIWWLTKTTGSATVLATATLVGLLPFVLLGPVAGVLVDRWSRRAVLFIADSMVALLTLGLALLFWTESVQVWHIYLLMFLRALAGGFHWAAMQASTSMMVPKEHLSRIQGLNQMLNGAMNIGSAPLGALLLEFLPMQGILGIDVGTALLAIIPLFFISIPQPERDLSPGDETSMWVDLKAGVLYTWAWPGLVMIMILAALVNLLVTPAFSLVPILVSKYFNGQAMQLAWMESSWGIGVVLGGLALSTWGGFRRRVVTTLAGLIILGAAMTGIGLIPSSQFLWAIALIFVVGLSVAMIDGPLMAVIQAVVAPDMQGRVFTLILSVAKAMTPLGLIVAGPVADRIGVQSWYVAGGILTTLVGAGAFLVPAVLNIEEGRIKEEKAIAGGQLQGAPLQPADLAEITGD